MDPGGDYLFCGFAREFLGFLPLTFTIDYRQIALDVVGDIEILAQT